MGLIWERCNDFLEIVRSSRTEMNEHAAWSTLLPQNLGTNQKPR